MRFLISRTSDNGDEQPYDKAIKGEDGRWGVYIESIEDLIGLVKEIGGEVIIYESFFNKDLYELEIYDDYRE